MGLIIRPAGIIRAGVSHRISAATLADVAREVGRLGEGIGRADWAFPDWRASATRTGQLSVNLTMNLAIFMPVWTLRSRRPAGEQAKWDRFYAALREHEDGHIAICRREVRTMYTRMTQATATTVTQVFNAELARIQQLNDDYDTRTQHGQRQNGRNGNTVINVP